MRRILPSEKIYIAQSKIPNAERGVFARMDITQGEVIEVCPVLEVIDSDEQKSNESMLVTYMYYLGTDKQRQVIALGFGSIYNHSKKSNAKYVDNQSEQILTFVAIQNITRDEEITVDYNPENTKDTSPLWFE